MTTLKWKVPCDTWPELNTAAVSQRVYYAVKLTSGDHESCAIGRHRQRTELGLYKTLEEAKRACEEHYANDPHTPHLKRPRGALRRAIVAGLISTDDAHEQGYMGKAELAL